MIADAHGPKIADLLEVQGGVTGIGLEERKVLVGQRSHFAPQPAVQGPEPRGGQVP